MINHNLETAGAWLTELDILLLQAHNIKDLELTKDDHQTIARHLQGARKVILNRFYN
jgi:hypothetical protein